MSTPNSKLSESHQRHPQTQNQQLLFLLQVASHFGVQLWQGPAHFSLFQKDWFFILMQTNIKCMRTDFHPFHCSVHWEHVLFFCELVGSPFTPAFIHTDKVLASFKMKSKDEQDCLTEKVSNIWESICSCFHTHCDFLSPSGLSTPVLCQFCNVATSLCHLHLPSQASSTPILLSFNLLLSTTPLVNKSRNSCVITKTSAASVTKGWLANHLIKGSHLVGCTNSGLQH